MLCNNFFILAAHCLTLAVVEGFPLSHDQSLGPRTLEPNAMPRLIMTRDANDPDFETFLTKRTGVDFNTTPIVARGLSRRKVAVHPQRRHAIVKRTLEELESRDLTLLLPRDPKKHHKHEDKKPADPKAGPPPAKPAPAKSSDPCAGKHGIHHSNCEVKKGFKTAGKAIKHAAEKVGHGVEKAAKTVGKGVEKAAKKVEKGVEKAAKAVYNKVLKPGWKWVKKNGVMIAEEVGAAVASAAIEVATGGAATGAVAGLQAGVQGAIRLGSAAPKIAKAAKGAASAAKDAEKAKDGGKIKQAAAAAKAGGKSIVNDHKVQHAAKKAGNHEAKDQVQQQLQGSNNNNQRQQ